MCGALVQDKWAVAWPSLSAVHGGVLVYQTQTVRNVKMMPNSLTPCSAAEVTEINGDKKERKSGITKGEEAVQ